jgi:hypothetical protein
MSLPEIHVEPINVDGANPPNKRPAEVRRYTDLRIPPAPPVVLVDNSFPEGSIPFLPVSTETWIKEFVPVGELVLSDEVIVLGPEKDGKVPIKRKHESYGPPGIVNLSQ